MAKLWSLRGLSWLELAKRTCRESRDDEIFGQSARMGLYFFFAFFPLLLLLLILLSEAMGGGSDWRAALVDSFRQVLPPEASALISQTIQEQNARAVFGAGAILAAAYAAWGALNGTWAVITGLNKAYEVEEKRPWWRILLIMFALTIAFGVLGLIALTAIVYGNRAGKMIGRQLGLTAHFALLWRVTEWTFIVIALLVSFSLLYRFGPNLKDRRWQWSVPGAVIAATLWVPSSLLLRAYQEHFRSSRVYGSLTAVATLLLWLYLTGAVIFIGGEANSEIEKAAAEAGHQDVRSPGEQRSGSSAQ